MGVGATTVEALVGGPVRASTPVTGGIHEAHRVETGDGRVLFVKTSHRAPVGVFAAEAEGLRRIREAEGAPPVPEVLSVHDEPDGASRGIVLSWVDAAPPRADADEVFGRRLAALHSAGHGRWGRGDQGFIGWVPMEPASAATWPEYYAAQLDALTRRAGLTEIADVVGRVPELVGPTESPSRLHGDLWSGNVLTGPDGHRWLIDPGFYGGHREVDLAMMQLFGGFSDRVFAAYEEVWPLADGWADRVALYQLLPLLVHAELFGGHYRRQVRDAAAVCR